MQCLSQLDEPDTDRNGDTDRMLKFTAYPGSAFDTAHTSGPHDLPLDTAVHSADTGEVELPPSDATVPFSKKTERPLLTRTGVLVLVIFGVLLVAAFVAVVFFTAFSVQEAP